MGFVPWRGFTPACSQETRRRNQKMRRHHRKFLLIWDRVGWTYFLLLITRYKTNNAPTAITASNPTGLGAGVGDGTVVTSGVVVEVTTAVDFIVGAGVCAAVSAAFSPVIAKMENPGVVAS